MNNAKKLNKTNMANIIGFGNQVNYCAEHFQPNRRWFLCADCIHYEYCNDCFNGTGTLEFCSYAVFK